MKALYFVVILLTLSFLPLLCPSGSAQVIPDNPEAAFDSVRTVAYEGRLEEAEHMARELVKNNPDYGDATVLLARIIAWQERYEEALGILDTLIAEQPGHADALEAGRTIREWMEASEEERITQPDTVVSVAPDAEVDIETGTDTLAKGVDIFLGYYFDTFSQPYSRFWQIFRIGAQYETKAGPLLGTVNFGNLHADTGDGIVETGIQVQAEFWPKISEKSYAWLAYAYSPFRYFPKHRAAAEYWYSLDRGWVVSAGASYFYFDRHIFIPTFSIEKYAGKYWLAARTYVHLKEAGTSSSVFLSARRYFNETDYLQLTAGAGTAPDEPWDLATDLDRQKAMAVKLSANKKISNSFTVKLGAAYSREEYLNEQRRNRFEGFLNIYYRPSR
ncbi:MAG: YaiO family outer membrane beta-barrel protein [Bacteroidota bacterium]